MGIHSRGQPVMSQTYIHVQMYNWQQIILDPKVLWILKNEPGDSSCDIYMKALDCNFHGEVTSYHISWVSYRTAEDHAKYHAKDRKTCNSNTDNPHELELGTDDGLNFINAILVSLS